MKILLKINGLIFSLMVCFILYVVSTTSLDNESTIFKGKYKYFNRSHNSEIRETKKYKFEHLFAEQCIAREIKNSINPENDRKRYEKPCLCIARRIAKNITKTDVERFLVERKSTQSLKMSFDKAAYFCLRKKARPKSPVLFGKKKQ